MTTIESLTETQIHKLRDEAATAGDDTMVAIIDAAMGRVTHCAVNDVGPTGLGGGLGDDALKPRPKPGATPVLP